MGLDFELEKIFGAKVFTNEPMRKHTSFKLGGNAKYFIKADYLVTVKRVVELLSRYNVPFKFIGNGSNLLVSDSGFDGAIINPCFNNISVENNLVVATSAVNLTTFSKFCEYHGFSGLEELSGIPGTVGGAIAMNASAFGVSISDYLEEVTILRDEKINIYHKEDCNFSYRDSLFKGSKFFIVNGKFSFKHKNIKEIQDKSKYILNLRKEIHPIGNSCGSVFRNTKKYSAGELIERSNLKGCKIGGAIVSDKHANFILTSSDCSSSDVYELIKYIKKTVYNKFDILLMEEVEYLGEF